MSKQYTDTIPIQIDFTNLPKVKFGVTEISDTLLVEVEVNGYALLKYKMREVQIDFRKLKKDVNSGAFYFLPNSNLKLISRQMNDNFKVLRVVTDTIQLNPRLR